MSALCAQSDPEAFFPEPYDIGTRNTAKGICERCPQRVECLALCFELDADHGIWGGIHERYRIRERLHTIFNAERPDAKQFAREVIAAYDAEYGLPSEKKRRAWDSHSEAWFRKLENERLLRAEKKDRIKRAS